MTERIVPIDPITDLQLKLRGERYKMERTYPDQPEFEAQARNIVKYERELKARRSGGDEDEQTNIVGSR